MALGYLRIVMQVLRRSTIERSSNSGVWTEIVGRQVFVSVIEANGEDW